MITLEASGLKGPRLLHLGGCLVRVALELVLVGRRCLAEVSLGDITGSPRGDFAEQSYFAKKDLPVMLIHRKVTIGYSSNRPIVFWAEHKVVGCASTFLVGLRPSF